MAIEYVQEDDVTDGPDMTYNGLPLVLVRVTATVSFDAFMVEKDDKGVQQKPERVAMDIADAVEHHAGRLESTCDMDALCVVATDVKVTMHHFDFIACQDTAEEIATMVEGMASETF